MQKLQSGSEVWLNLVKTVEEVVFRKSWNRKFHADLPVVADVHLLLPVGPQY